MAAVGGAGEISLEPLCFDPESVPSCAQLFPEERTGELAPVLILDTAEQGLGARFSLLGGWAALVARLPDVGLSRVVLAKINGGSQSFDVDPAHADGELSIRSVWGNAERFVSDVLQTHVVALGCKASGTDCQLLADASDEGVLRALPEYALPPSAQVRDLASAQGRLCAFGIGVFCLEADGWRTVVEPNAALESQPILEVALGYPSAAVSSGAQLFVETEEGDWRPHVSRFKPPIAFETYGSTLSLLALDGTWSVQSLDPPGFSTCEQSPRLRVAAPGPGRFGSPWVVGDESVRIFTQRVTYEEPRPPVATLTWCRLASALTDPLLDVGAIHCGEGTNVLSITHNGFYSHMGRITCPIR